MNKFMKTTKTLMLGAVLAAATVLTACSDDKNNGMNQYVFTDYVTLTGDNDNGATFTMHVDMNSPLLTYTSTRRLPSDKVKVGQRCVIMYTFPDGREFQANGQIARSSGPIDVSAYQTCINGGIEWKTSEDTNRFMTNSVQCQGAWIAGNYLNFNVAGLYRNEPKAFKLVADEATIDKAMPDVYLIFEADDQVGGAWKEIYASLDVSDIWANNKYDGFVLHMANEFTAMGNTLTFTRKATITPAE